MDFSGLLKTFRRQNVALNIVENCKKKCLNVAQKWEKMLQILLKSQESTQECWKCEIVLQTRKSAQCNRVCILRREMSFLLSDLLSPNASTSGKSFGVEISHHISLLISRNKKSYIYVLISCTCLLAGSSNSF